MMSITNTKFSITPEGIDKYLLNIEFLEDGITSSTKTFAFSKNFSLQEGNPLLDAYSINGGYSSKILKRLFKKSDVQGVGCAIQKLKEMEMEGSTMVVLDIKSQKGYEDPSISKAEMIVCDFFGSEKTQSKASKHAMKVHELFLKNKPIDFIICEGSLKGRLVREFSPEQASFLETKSGAMAFCQIAEFFMNAFKFGHKVLDISADKYIVSTSGKVFTPSKKSSVLYPSLYEDLYSIDGIFAKTLAPIFHVTGNFDPLSQITLMNVEVKT